MNPSAARRDVIAASVATCYNSGVIGESSSGRTADSESVSEGSNPSSPANYLDRLIVWRFGSCPELYTQPVTDVHKGKQVIAAYHPNDVTVFDHR